MDINAFIVDNFIIIVVIAIVLIMTIIGFIAKQTGFGGKVSSRNQQNNLGDDSDIEQLNEIVENFDNSKTNNEALDALDTIAPNFNDGGLVIGDVNQNPAITNQELGISEDLYAPFGDDTKSKEVSIEDLKIEDVEESDDFNIIDKDNLNNETVDELVIEDVNPTTGTFDNQELENLQIEDVNATENSDSEISQSVDPVVEEINNLVDNTFVINDGTSDFDKNEIAEEKNEEQESEPVSEPSKVEQFDIGEGELADEETNDFEIEATTNLKLDEINEKIKNLKLEDLDNQNLDDDIEEVKKAKKKKTVSVKSVDEIKKDSSRGKNENIDVVADLPLPSLNEVGDDKDISEEDDIWNF
ncbi:MAG: hypothetical protein HFI87_01935 [Bacilli bacterium]|nr:hypothetical protein [Bacilli bacterium]